MHVATDVGGTFTDFIVYDGGELRAFKVLTARSPEEGVLKGLGDMRLASFSHGTTLATNALIEGRGARTALVATEGFGDVIFIGRQNRLDIYDFEARKALPPLERDMVVEVRERIGPGGEVIRPLTPEEVERVVSVLEEKGVESVAVCLLFSFAGDAHERALGEALRKRFPHVSLSCDVAPEFREYERTVTTFVNAYVEPAVREYLHVLHGATREDMWVITSGGGCVPAAKTTPVSMILSGPAGGVTASRYLCHLKGVRNAITIDMGGTSADVAAIVDGEVRRAYRGEIAGLPLHVPMVDMVTIGAGGGSIAWVDEGGALHVGPRSAGSHPGPACYGRGGTEFTVSDANLLLGFLGETIAGGMRLSREGAMKACDAIAKRLNLDTMEVAEGVWEIVNSNMVSAIKAVTLQRGLDPRDFALVAFGGAGPIHAAALAEMLDIERVLIPFHAGAFSAFGILVADAVYDYRVTRIMPLREAGETIEGTLSTFRERALEEMRDADLREEDAVFIPSVDLRYSGQGYELNVPYTGVADSEAKFHAAHEREYGYSSPDMEVELVNIRLRVSVRRLSLSLKERKEAAMERAGERAIIWKGEEWSADIYRGPLFGATLDGPCVVEDETFTTLVPPGWTLAADGYGIYELRRCRR